MERNGMNRILNLLKKNGTEWIGFEKLRISFVPFRSVPFRSVPESKNVAGLWLGVGGGRLLTFPLLRDRPRDLVGEVPPWWKVKVPKKFNPELKKKYVEKSSVAGEVVARDKVLFLDDLSKE